MADVTVTLGARDAGLQAAMNRAQGAAQNFMSTFSNVAAPLAALGALAGAFTAVKGTLDMGGRLSDISSQTGIAVGDLVVLEQAFKNSGLSAEQVGPSINKLQRAIVEAGQGSTGASETFAKLGLSLAQLESQSPSEQFKSVATAIQGLQSPAARTAAAMEIFGKSGGKMLTLFADSNAFAQAATQVGGLAGVMDASAGQFDTLSDSLGAASLKGQQLSAGFTAALAPALEGIASALDQTDLTSLGQSLGTMAVAAFNLATTLSTMIPAIIGVTVAFAAFRSGVDAKVISAIARIGPVSSAAFAQMRIAMASASINFTTMGAAGRAAFVSIAIAARGAALAIKGALISTGIGIIIAGIAFAIEALMGHLAASKAAIENLNSSMQDSISAARALSEEMDKISTEAEKVSFGKRLEEEIERTRKKIAELQNDKKLGDKDKNMGVSGLQSQIASLEALRTAAGNITPEVLAGRQAEKDRAAALAESERQAASLNAELGKGKEALDKKISDSAFNDLGAKEQKDSTLSGVGLGSTAAVDAEVEALAAKRESTFLTGEEAKRMEALLEARSKLVDIEKAINSEREKASDQAARDQERAEAEARVAAEKAAANVELQKTLQLELAIAEARASKDTQEEAKLQFVKDYQTALERARQAGIEGNAAFEFANRSANAGAAARQEDGSPSGQNTSATNQPLFASSLAKIGGGGAIAGVPGLLDENKKQTNILQTLADVSKSVLPEISARLEGIFSKPAEPKVPSIQAPEVPSLKVPSIQAPEVPSLKVPGIQAPEFPSLKSLGGLGNFPSAILDESRRQTNFLRQIYLRLSNLNPNTSPLLT